MNELPPIRKRSFQIIRVIVNIGFWVGAVALAAILLVGLFAPQTQVTYRGYVAEGFLFSPIPGVQTGWETVPFNVLWMLFGVAFLWLLKCILNSMGKGTPFTGQNASRLMWMGILALLQSYTGQWNAYRMAQALFQYNVQQGISPMIRPQFQLLPDSALLGICLLILAEVFRYGVILQQEHDTTV